jgi:5,10-methylene-tetrahydrofolate dehydrogenase/methenyl tetrahydrofolate cyclohydrolase
MAENPPNVLKPRHPAGPIFDFKETHMTALTNKTAIVTGASRGMGRAAALALAAAGGHAAVRAMQTLKRIGQPADVASVIAFLVSDGLAGSPAKLSQSMVALGFGPARRIKNGSVEPFPANHRSRAL